MGNLFIPSKIKVGFQERQGTFTGKLAYVIYFDTKGVLRKETSWNGWRDENIDALEIDNSPRAGYIFNKGVQRGGYHWGSGRSSIRVYDPRDFEFEISVENLMGLLMHSDVSKRDIVEECVFAWDGPELVLLPVSSEAYQSSILYTKKLSEKVSAKSLVGGYTYNQKREDEVLTYIGYHEWFDWAADKEMPVAGSGKYDNDFHTTHHCLGKKHIFYQESNKTYRPCSMETLSSVNTEEVSDNYALLVENFFNTVNSQEIVDAKVLQSESLCASNYVRACREVNKTFAEISIYLHSRDKLHGIDGNLNKSTFLFANRKTIKQGQDTAKRDSWGYRVTSKELEQELAEAAKLMGLDINGLSNESLSKVLTERGFGNLFFVLKNGALCKS